MAELYMSPRSRTYSGGDLIPYQERAAYGGTYAPEAATGIAIGTEPPAAPQSSAPTASGNRGGFMAGLSDLAARLAPYVEAAVAFKQGYQTGQLPRQRYFAGQRPIENVIADLRQRNEAASEQARVERENVRKENLRSQLITAAVTSGKLSPADALKALETGDLSVVAKPASQVGSAAPANYETYRGSEAGGYVNPAFGDESSKTIGAAAIDRMASALGISRQEAAKQALDQGYVLGDLARGYL